MNLSNHPIHFLDSLRKHRQADRIEVRFVTYSYEANKGYGKGGDGNDREYFHVPLARVTEEWLRTVLQKLPDDHTFGFTGRVTIDERSAYERANCVVNEADYFIPVLDLKGTVPPDAFDVERHFEMTKNDPFCDSAEMALYRTDKSFHIYFATLKPLSAITTFLGDALLFNSVPMDGSSEGPLEENIDTRWVGHSLRREMPTVRWSRKNHDKTHSAPPTLVNDGEWPAPSFMERAPTPSKPDMDDFRALFGDAP